jgi:predicted amidohydrolase YtcJ
LIVSTLVLIVNARIATGDPRRPWADAVVLEGDQVVVIGSSAELRTRCGAQVRVIDAQGVLLDPAQSVAVAQRIVRMEGTP